MTVTTRQHNKQLFKSVDWPQQW